MDSGGGQLLFDKNSPRGDTMRIKTAPNKEDRTNAVNSNNQWKKQNSNKILLQQTLSKEFFHSRIISNSVGNIPHNHGTDNVSMDEQDLADNWKKIISKKKITSQS